MKLENELPSASDVDRLLYEMPSILVFQVLSQARSRGEHIIPVREVIVEVRTRMVEIGDSRNHHLVGIHTLVHEDLPEAFRRNTKLSISVRESSRGGVRQVSRKSK